MIMVNTHEAKTNFSSLMHSVEKFSETILVCRNGHPIAEISAVERPVRKGLPRPNPKLSLNANYDLTEPLCDEDLPEVCR